MPFFCMGILRMSGVLSKPVDVNDDDGTCSDGVDDDDEYADEGEYGNDCSVDGGGGADDVACWTGYDDYDKDGKCNT